MVALSYSIRLPEAVVTSVDNVAGGVWLACTLVAWPANPIRPAAEQACERYEGSFRVPLELAALLLVEGKQHDIAATSIGSGFGR